MTILDIISGFKDLAIAGAAITTVTIAVYGIKNWSRELKGRASFEVARGLIRSTYKLRDELGYSRSPFTNASEFPQNYTRPAPGQDRDHEKESEAWAYVFTNRWKPVAEAQLEFESQVLEAEALWGADIKAKATELRQCSRGIRVAMEAMISNKASGGEDFRSDVKYGIATQADVWATKEDKNKMSISINEAVAAIEEAVRPHIRRN